MLHGIIPVKSTLTNRHTETDDQCRICHDHPEDLKHLLFECAPAKMMWYTLKLEQAVSDACIVDRSDSTVLEELLDSSTESLPSSISGRDCGGCGDRNMVHLVDQTDNHTQGMDTLSNELEVICSVPMHKLHQNSSE